MAAYTPVEKRRRGRRRADQGVRPTKQKWWAVWLLVSVVLPAFEGPQAAPPAAPQASEYQVKAAFLLNFTKFIEWPGAAFEDASSPITICILGNDPFDSALSQVVEGEVVNGRKIAIQKIRRAPSPKSCQVLFVDSSEKEVRKTLGGVGPGVLTVGEGEGFLRDGGMIAFVLDHRRVRFVINQSAAASASLTMSSRLLNVAKAVEK